METLLPLLFIIGVTILSLLNKAVEKKRLEDQRREQAKRKTSPDPLPEATRRMVYGDRVPPMRPAAPEIRTAQPAKPAAAPESPSAPEVPEALRRILEALNPDLAQQLAPQRPAPAPPAPQPPQPAPRRRIPEQAAPPSEPSVIVCNPPGLEKRLRTQPVQSSRPVRTKRPRQERPGPRVGQQRKPQGLREGPRPIPPRSRVPVSSPPPPAHALGSVLENLDDVRRGIILSEILGSPVSMR